jgi:hypothetical protein
MKWYVLVVYPLFPVLQSSSRAVQIRPQAVEVERCCVAVSERNGNKRR